MKISRIAGIAAAACLVVSAPMGFAQNAPAAKSGAAKPLVIVNRQIDAKALRLTSAGQWHRLEVELKALPEGIKDALTAAGVTDSKVNNASVKWVNNIKVTLVAGYKPSGADLGKPKVMQEVVKLKEAVQGGKSYADAKDASKADNWRYYKASATVLTLEANNPRSVFFYIPGDIVKRDDIGNPKPDIAYVTLQVDGGEVPIFDASGNLFTGSFGALLQSGRPSKEVVEKAREIAERGTRDTDGVMRPQHLVTGFIDADWSKASPEFVLENAAK